ncbi:MAG TPA: TIGR01459 family HAD-type hydrolase [Aliidongia sp.]|nr:TIGR01459 family HAD-type hydrolase [Aliidongia sp.]
MSTTILDGVASVAPLYDGFILDVWGVLHNGREPYPGVTDALAHLIAAGKRVALLSNAPMRAETVARRVGNIGIERGLFHQVMTSGEEVWQMLRDRTDPYFASLGRDCLYYGASRHRGMLEGLDLNEVADPAEASFVFNTGPDDLDDAATLYMPALEAAARRDLPMVCANADLHVVDGDRLIACAGMMAVRYEELGGRVSWHGKPYPSVYQACRALLGIEDPARILCVGDSLRTDIAGARGVGLDAMLVTNGIHEGEFGSPIDPVLLAGRLAGEPQPRWAIEGLVW